MASPAPPPVAASPLSARAGARSLRPATPDRRLVGPGRRLGAELARVLPMAAMAVLLGVAAEFIVAVRPVEPLDTPLPVIDQAPLAPIERADRAVSQRIDREPLPAEIRAVGAAFLAWNREAAASPRVGQNPADPRRQALQGDLRGALGVARGALGEAKTFAYLRDLRAHHTELFMRELADRRAGAGGRTRDASELTALAGALVDLLAANGWVGAEGKIHAPPAILRTRYKLHWTSVVLGLDDCDHAPAPNCYGQTSPIPLEVAELRSLLAFLVAYPVVRGADFHGQAGVAEAIDRRRLVYLDRLEALDAFADPTRTVRPYLGDYPIDLARGAILYRLGNYAESARSLDRARTQRPDDMRAKNWLLAALQKLEPFD